MVRESLRGSVGMIRDLPTSSNKRESINVNQTSPYLKQSYRSSKRKNKLNISSSSQTSKEMKSKSQPKIEPLKLPSTFHNQTLNDRKYRPRG